MINETKSPTSILGISAYYHDSAACLVRDGKARVRSGAVYLYFILEVRPGIAQIEIVTNAG